jgi:hypothetical protein
MLPGTPHRAPAENEVMTQMPKPDVVLEIGINRNAKIGDDGLAAIQALVQSAVPLGDTARVLTILSERAGLDEKVLSIGLWSDDEGDSDAQLEAALTAAGPLTPRRGAALLFTAHALQFLASRAWKDVDKKIDARIGLVRLSDDVSVKVDNDVIVTTVRGEYKIRFLPNLPFKFRIRERLDVQRAGSGPPLVVVENAKKMIVGMLKIAAVLSFLSPALGALAFWQGDDLAEAIAPTPDFGGAGGKLAAQWPAEILTDIAPPARPGKFTFLWTELLVDVTGVRTRGALLPSSRTPEVFINGPASITLHQPHGSTVATYQAVIQDLRRPLRRLRWIVDGVSAGQRATQEVNFGIPGAADPPLETRLVRVEVTDADGLVAAREMSVRFQVTPAPGRHQPL